MKKGNNPTSMKKDNRKSPINTIMRISMNNNEDQKKDIQNPILI